MNKRRPRVTNDEYEILKKYRAIKDECDKHNIDPQTVKHGWLKSKDSSLHFHNPNFNIPEFDPEKIDFSKIVSSVVQYQPKPKIANSNYGIFDRLVYTDTHIGMDVNPHNKSQYGGKWDEDEIFKQLDAMLAYVKQEKMSDVIIVDDLGDLLDGWDSKTVRKKHDLPQNMNNEEAFDVALRFKLKQASFLYNIYNKVIFNNISEDNHSGAFGAILNNAFKVICNQMFDDSVIVNNYNKFFNHYKYMNNTFIITHGKDSTGLKAGLKPNLSVKGKEQIENYIDNNYLLERGTRIELSKGDTHVEVYDKNSSSKFDYFNYPAFSPPSYWVQANYTPRDYGFVFYNFKDTNHYYKKPFYFNQ
ncbi:MAG TPA: hypothetical protein DHM42_09870 [Clostridiales bacterium]|nr:hypothetical protein [Clostridiales bacterium]